MNPQDSTQITFTQVYNDFKGALSGAADALKTGSEHVYEILVRQQFVNSVSMCILYFLLVGLSAWLWFFIPKKVKEFNDESSYSDYGPLYIIPSVVSLVSMLIITATITDVVTGFVNPEYGAIQEIREFIR